MTKKAERLTPYWRSVIAAAEEAEHHQINNTGSYKTKVNTLMQIIRDHKREPRREAAREAMK